MSAYDDNFGEHYERDIIESQAYERQLEAEELEHVELVRLDRLRRDWPVLRRAAVSVAEGETT